jgi:hypothetical protein
MIQNTNFEKIGGRKMSDRKIKLLVTLLCSGIVLFNVGVLGGYGCWSSTSTNGDSNDTLYVPAKIFGDSTYIRGKDSYRIGERIYVIAVEPTMVGPGYPDTLPKPVEILVISTLGDSERISATSDIPVDTDGMTVVYGGTIKSKALFSPVIGNGTLEVDYLSSTILALYAYVSGITVEDTAQMVP